MAEAQFAKQISVHACEHGSVHIVLVGDDGKVFAAAVMDALQAADFTADLIVEVEVAAKICGVDLDDDTADGAPRSVN